MTRIGAHECDAARDALALLVGTYTGDREGAAAILGNGCTRCILASTLGIAKTLTSTIAAYQNRSPLDVLDEIRSVLP
jgi:hypothetical protein